MPPLFYIIPTTSPPYSRENPQNPQFVDNIQCNWTGHNIDAFNVYICKVNTTPAKHALLNMQPGVIQLPPVDTVINTLGTGAQNVISSKCAGLGIPFDPTETVGSLIYRVILCGLFDIRAEILTTQFQNLTLNQQNKVTSICNRWDIAINQTDTIKQLALKIGLAIWPFDLAVGEF